MEAPFRRQVQAMRAAGFRDIYIFGTAGEGYAVDSAQFRAISEVFLDEMRGDEMRPQIGVIALSTAGYIERLSVAYKLGCRMFQISLPCWHALNDAELMRFFHDVCGAFPDAQFLHYNLDRAKRRLFAADYRRLCDEIPNLVAAKITGNDLDEAKKAMNLVPELQAFFTEPLFIRAAPHGPCSLLSAYAPLNPQRAKQLFETASAQRWNELESLEEAYKRLRAELFAPLGAQPRIDGAYDKLLARLGGHEMPLRLLSPYESATEAEFQACDAILRDRFPDWLAPSASSRLE